MHGSKTKIEKISGQIFRLTIEYLKENSKVRDFSGEILPRNKKNIYFLALKWRVDLYMGSTYTRVNTLVTQTE